MAKLIFGCGYLGLRVAERWKAAGDEVFVVTRSGERAARFEQQGMRPIMADVTRPDSIGGLPQAATVLYAVGYDRASGMPMHQVYVEGLRAVLDALPQPEKLIYISSTGVYGQTSGEWVDEQSPCEPQREGGRACLAAEEVLKTHQVGQRAVVLRLAGIYGPRRIAGHAELLSGPPIAAAPKGFLNLIHVDDAVSVVFGAVERAAPPCTYVVSDGHPVEREVYYQHIARLLGAERPQFEALPQDGPRMRRAASSKRISNARIISELGVELAYPTYRDGLAAIIAGEQ